MVLKAGRLRLTLRFQGARLRRIDFPPMVPAGLGKKELEEALRHLSEYEWDLDIGAPFHREVWQYLRRIPSGQVRTYGEVANDLGRPKAARAVGAACAANPLLLLVPCHRVVGAKGLGGFRAGLEWKERLLEIEAASQ